MLLFFRRHARTLVALFFAALLLVGLCTQQYGSAWDDVGEMNILRMALKEYASILPFETSYSEWLLSSPLPRISESIERDHGICAYYPLFWAMCRDDISLQNLTFIWRAHTWVLFTLGMYALYACARHMGINRFFSCLGVMIVLLSPRFFAEGHYNNKDIALMTFTLLLFWQSMRLMEKPTVGRGLCFAVAAGFCAGTRVIGVAFCGLFGLMIVCHLLSRRQLTRRVVGIGAMSVAVSVLLYIVLTPAFLADPAGFIQHLLSNAVGFSRWHGTVLHWGEAYSCAITKPPRSYLPTMILITTPLWALALLAVGCGVILRMLASKRLNALKAPASLGAATALLSWLLPLAGGIAIRMLVYNGWRHVYFLYGPMVLCMVWGLNWLWAKLRGKGKALCAVCLGACMVSTAYGIAVNHPYQYAYFNLLVPTENRAALFEMDYWNLSCVDALEALLAQTDGEIRIAASDRQTRSGLSMAQNYLCSERIFVVTETDTETKPNYLLANLSYAAIDGFVPTEKMTQVVKIESYGSDMTVIYALED